MGSIMKIKADFVALAKTFAGRWVALDPKSYEVVADAATAGEALHQALDAGRENPIVFRVVENYGAVAPCLVRF